MTGPRLQHQHPEILSAFGMPRRLLQTRPFVLRGALEPTEFGHPPKHVSVSHQLAAYATMCTADTGWMAYLCGNGDLTPARVVAASILSANWAADRRVAWLTTFDKVDRVQFRELKLLVLDALFADSPSFRRDRFYEIINHHANVEDLSILVVCNNSLDGAIAQLGMRPNFAMAFRGHR